MCCTPSGVVVIENGAGGPAAAADPALATVIAAATSTAEPHRQQTDGQPRQRGTGTGCHRCADLIEPGGSGDRESERDPVEEERAGERAEQKIFERRLGAAWARAPKAGEGVFDDVDDRAALSLNPPRW